MIVSAKTVALKFCRIYATSRNNTACAEKVNKNGFYRHARPIDRPVRPDDSRRLILTILYKRDIRQLVDIVSGEGWAADWATIAGIGFRGRYPADSDCFSSYGYKFT